MQPPRKYASENPFPPGADDDVPIEKYLNSAPGQKLLTLIAYYGTKTHIYSPDEPITITLPKPTLQVLQELQQGIKNPDAHVMPRRYGKNPKEKFIPIREKDPKEWHTDIERQVSNYQHWVAWDHGLDEKIVAEKITVKHPLTWQLQERYLKLAEAELLYLDLNMDKSTEKKLKEKAAGYARRCAEIDACYVVTNFFKTYIEKAPKLHKDSYEAMRENAREEMVKAGFPNWQANRILSDANIEFGKEMDRRAEKEKVKKNNDAKPGTFKPMPEPVKGPRVEEAEIEGLGQFEATPLPRHLTQKPLQKG